MSWSIAGTLVGGAVGSLAGGVSITAGAQIGATVGMLLDGLTQKSPKQHGDTRYSSVSYGSPINRIWGYARVDCQVIWVLRNSDGSYLRNVPAGGKKGKKGGGDQVPHSHATYAINIAETGFTFPDGTQVERPITIDRIRMGDIIVYTSASALPIPAYAGGTTYSFGDYVKSGSITYTSLADGNTGHTPASNPAWWHPVSTAKNSINFTVHPGPAEATFTMGVDSTISTSDGVAHTSAYRGWTYILVDDQDFFDVGNTFPTNISIEAHTAAVTDEDFLTDICLFAGLKTSDFDFSNCTDVLHGFSQNRSMSAQDLLTNFLVAKAYDLVEVDGVIHAVKRGGALSATIPDSALGSSDSPPTTTDRLPFTILADRRELHNNFSLSYISASQDFRKIEISSARNDGLSENNYTFDTGLTLTDDDAAQMLARLHETEYLEGGGEYGPIKLTGLYGALAPTDTIELLFNGKLTRFRITKQTWKPNLTDSWLARDEVSVLDQSHVTGDTGGYASSGSDNVPSHAFVIASPPFDISDTFATFPGFYVWAANAEGRTNADIYYSFDNFATDPIYGGKLSATCFFGNVVTALPNAGGVGADTTSTAYLTPVIGNGVMEMADASTNAINSGTHWALLGTEWIGVGGVGAPGPPQQFGANGYGLLRGLRGSPYTGHGSNEQFAMATNVRATVKVEVDPQYVGQTVYVQVLAKGQAIGDSPTKTCVIYDPTKPYVVNSAPVDPSAITDGTPTYSGTTEVLSFNAVYPTTPPAGQLLNWQYSTNSGSSWSSSTLTGTSYAPPGFTSGTMMVQAQALTTDGRMGTFVQSSDITYTAPSVTTPFGEVPSGTVDGVNNVFTLSHTPISGTLSFTKNGLTQTPGVDYTIAGVTITTTLPPLLGDTLYSMYYY